LYKYDKGYFDKRAKETGFIRDNLEKVFRLTDILEYINRNPLHRDCLALKGGTAINLVVFNMKRLSEKSKLLDFPEYPNLNKIQTILQKRLDFDICLA